MSRKKNPCGWDYCPYAELIGAYASCVTCAWGEDDEPKDKPKEEKVMSDATN